MEYPIVFKRKRTGSIILNSILIAVSLAMLIYGLTAGEKVTIYIISLVVFCFSLGFNIFLISEKTLIIEADKIYTSSVFLPKLYVEVENLRGVEYSGEKKDELKINYDLPEYNVRSILGDIELSENRFEGLWNYTLTQKDVDRPLSEVKFLIQNLVITRDSKLT